MLWLNIASSSPYKLSQMYVQHIWSGDELYYQKIFLCFYQTNISLQNVVAWTNLGTLYLKKDNIEVRVIFFFSCTFFLFEHLLEHFDF